MPNCALESFQPCNTAIEHWDQLFFKIYIPGMRMVKIFHFMKIILDGTIKTRPEESCRLLIQLGCRYQGMRLNGTEDDAGRNSFYKISSSHSYSVTILNDNIR